jgi:hypothetical protein
MQMRRLGRTGLQVTAIGCGGIPILRAEKLEAVKGRRDEVVIASKATVRTREEMATAADERARWDREYCRLCYSRKESCREEVPSRNLMILDLNHRRSGMKRLMSPGVDKQIAAAAACATCAHHECAGSCSYHLPIPGILTRLHRTYTPIAEAWNAKQATP